MRLVAIVHEKHLQGEEGRMLVRGQHGPAMSSARAVHVPSAPPRSTLGPSFHASQGESASCRAARLMLIISYFVSTRARTLPELCPGASPSGGSRRTSAELPDTYRICALK